MLILQCSIGPALETTMNDFFPALSLYAVTALVSIVLALSWVA